MTHKNKPFRLNVGFVVSQPVGYSRDFPLNLFNFHIPPDLDLHTLIGNVRISRTPQGLLARADLAANIPSNCVRCLKDFPLPLEIHFTELFAFSERHASESGLILPEDYHIDFSPLIREYLFLEVPINPICQSNCKGLCPTCGENLNDFPHMHGEGDNDPRLEVLKDLLKE